MNAIATLLKPRSVAVIGASADLAKTSGKPIYFLRKHGFKGDIFPVNPRADAVAGLKCFPDIVALPETPDVGLVLLGAERATAAVAALAQRGTKAAIVLASGFGEVGQEGLARQVALKRAAGQMRLLGPNTIGLVNLTDAIPLSASGALDMDQFPVGSISFVSQSGGIVGSYLSRAAGRGIGLAKLISTSNEADLELADFIEHLADDDATKVIALYIETIRDPGHFVAAVAKARNHGKPVVAYKIGRSEAGARAAASHTGALAGSDDVYDAFFKQLGVIRAENFSDLLDIPLALARGRALRGSRVAVLTTTGGAGTLVSDSLGFRGLQTPPPDHSTVQTLAALQKDVPADFGSNPIDLTLAGAKPEILRGAMTSLLNDPSFDALVVVVGSSAVGNPALFSDAVAASLGKTDKPILAFVSAHAPDAAALMTSKGVPTYTAPESIAASLAAMWHSAQPPSMPAHATSQYGARLPVLSSGPLDEAEAKQLFAHFGLPIVRERIVTSASDAKRAARDFGGRVVLKVLSRTITHKSDIGGVAINVSEADIAQRISTMADTVHAGTGERPTSFLVQELVVGGIEIILGLKRDPLGPVLLVGAGGVAAELYQDTALVVLGHGLSFGDANALAMLRGLKSWPLLDGFRGRPKADVPALIEAITRFAGMALSLGGRLIEAEINPLLVLPLGQGVRAADGVVLLGGGTTKSSEIDSDSNIGSGEQ